MDSLEEIAQLVRRCVDCSLHQGRINAVPGEGPPDADLLFIGEGPGFQEDRQGRPFVGPAGKFLEELLASIGLRREDVFIANMVKCRPPQNRDPLPEETRACNKYLERQIELINPKLIVSGVVLCMHEGQTILAGEVIADVKQFLADARGTDLPWAGAEVYQPPIRRNIKLAESPSFGQSIFDYDANCHGAKDYARLAASVAAHHLAGS